MGAIIFNGVPALRSKLRLIVGVLFLSSTLFGQNVALAAEDLKLISETSMQEGKIAFESKMYDFSKSLFEKALELDRSNYEAMLYLAKVNYHLEEYNLGTKYASTLASSFYPSKDLKIEALQLLGAIENKKNNPWLALSYIQASSNLSTNIDISHLVDEQIALLDFNSLAYPDFSTDSDGVITSDTLSFEGGTFSDNVSEEQFSPVSYQVKAIDTKFVVLAGFDDRKRFTKLLLLRSKQGLKPKLEELAIQGRTRGGITGANDLYLKVMDWNFDGYPDLAVRITSHRSENKQAFLLFNPQNERFDVNEELSKLVNPILDRKSKAIIEEDCDRGKDAACMRKRYKLFSGEFALAQFEKNRCKKTCIYTKSEIEVSSLRTGEHMYLVNTIETDFKALKSRFSSSDSGTHTIITRRVLKAYYSPNYDVKQNEQPIMVLDLDGSWEFPATYIKNWVNNYFSPQPLNGQLADPVSDRKIGVIN
jgi:tetratricopeptide (TPR) repeat protein